jgi:hypothetical protein
MERGRQDSAMRIEVLGDSRVITNGVAQVLPGGRPGLLPQALLLQPSEPVEAGRLIRTLLPAARRQGGRGPVSPRADRQSL